MTNNKCTVIGAGLAGCEAAWQLASRRINVELYEMKPQRMSPAHISPDFSELVCSNSFRSNEKTNSVGLLKEEMRKLGSLIVTCADETSVPAGSALAVDRSKFASKVTKLIENHPLINVVRQEVTDIPAGRVIIATGPLTSDALAEQILEVLPDPNNEDDTAAGLGLAHPERVAGLEDVLDGLYVLH